MDSENCNPVRRAQRLEMVEQCLRNSSHFNLKHISCDFVDDMLVLRGCVPTYYLKQMAVAMVAQLEGIDHIDNQIEVVAPVAQIRRE